MRSTHGDHALYALALREVCSLGGPPIVDVGCGRGALLGLLAGKGARAIGIDCVHGDLRTAAGEGARAARPGGIRVVQGDAQALPLRTGSLGGATSFLVAHRLSDPGRALSEMRRVLRPGGWLILADRVTDPETAAREGRDAIERTRSAAYRRLLTSGELRVLCEAAGFEVLAEMSCEKRLALGDWLTPMDEDRRSMLHAWIRAAHPRTIRLDGGDVVLSETILRCRARRPLVTSPGP